MILTCLKVALLLWSTLQARHQFFHHYGLISLFVDFLLNVGAILFATTLYSSQPLLLNALLLIPALFLFLIPSQAKPWRKPLKEPKINASSTTVDDHKTNDVLPTRPFITAYRGSMMIITCIAILAVDFTVFPRRFAKVETWGTSLMDLGVGSFVFSAGLISARSILKDRLAGTTKSAYSRLFMSTRHSIPLMLLGLIRLYSVKGLDFAEHVSEYGVHWNFFFTLAFLSPSVAILQSFLVFVPSIASLSLLVGGIYQAVLEYTNLKLYILSAPRTNLLNQNREGVFSFYGYLAIFLAGQAAGLDILPQHPERNRMPDSTAKQRKQLLLRLAFYSLSYTLLTFFAISHRYGFSLQVSRRLANFPYIVWVAAFNCTQLTIFCAIESCFFPEVFKAKNKKIESRESDRATSRVLKAFNRNSLAIFLLANPLTGLVNKTLDTLTTSKEASICILLIYAGFLAFIAVILDQLDVSIKM